MTKILKNVESSCDSRLEKTRYRRNSSAAEVQTFVEIESFKTLNKRKRFRPRSEFSHQRHPKNPRLLYRLPTIQHSDLPTISTFSPQISPRPRPLPFRKSPSKNPNLKNLKNISTPSEKYLAPTKLYSRGKNSSPACVQLRAAPQSRALLSRAAASPAVARGRPDLGMRACACA